MRPLKGIVVKVRKGFMEIDLESGNTITTKKVSKMVRGSRVDVLYDFTHNRVRDIWLENSQSWVSLPEELEEEVKEEEQEFREFSSPVFDDEEGEPVGNALADDDLFGEEEDEDSWLDDYLPWYP